MAVVLFACLYNKACMCRWVWLVDLWFLSAFFPRFSLWQGQVKFSLTPLTSLPSATPAASVHLICTHTHFTCSSLGWRFLPAERFFIICMSPNVSIFSSVYNFRGWVVDTIFRYSTSTYRLILLSVRMGMAWIVILFAFWAAYMFTCEWHWHMQY